MFIPVNILMIMTMTSAHPAVSRLIHVALDFASVLHQVVDSSITQGRQVRRREYCLYTTHIHTHNGISLFQRPFSRWTWVSRCLLKQRMMEVVVTTAAISRAKLQSNHHQQTNIQFFLQAECPSCHPTNSVKALEGKYHIPCTCLPQAYLGVFQLCLWPVTTNSSRLPWGRVAMPLISPLMPAPHGWHYLH